MKNRPRKTRPSRDEPGHAHFLTYSCYRRLPLLSRDRVRRWVVDALLRTREELDVGLWAYVIMPEHVHVLLHPRAAHYEMRRILPFLKQPVAKAARHWLEEQHQRAWLEQDRPLSPEIKERNSSMTGIEPNQMVGQVVAE